MENENKFQGLYNQGLEETYTINQVEEALSAITEASSESENLMPFIIDAAIKHATLGEIVESMKVVFGEWEESEVI